MTNQSRAPFRRRMQAATALSPFAGATGVVAALLLLAVPAQGQDGAPPAPSPNPVTPVPGGGTRLDYGANGVPVVKIATPDARGTSYNRYQTFNIDGRGLVLNNSDKIVQSRLAGFIDGNGQLKNSGPASLIINEVVAANRSDLGGYLEIAGAPADLVLANPYGISCNGCGFVNAPRVTLAAATPTLDAAGALAGFRATTGTIAVTGRGLDATNARLELFARAVTINAGLYADTVTASFGAGAVTRDGEVVVTGRREPAQADQPAFGLDVAALGGMYARSIRLIGTEQGLGVNVAGDLAGLEGGVALSADGRVSVAGAVTARTAVAIDATGALDVGGQIYAEGSTTLAAAALTGGGLIGAGGDLKVTAGAVTSGGTLAAGLARDGRVTQAGALTLDVAGAAALSGRLLTRDALTLTAGAVVNRGLASGGALTLRAGSLDNAGGVLDARDALDARAGAVTNTGGAIQSGGTLALSAASLANERGAVLALGGGALTLRVAGAVAGVDGRIAGNGDVGVDAGSLNVAGANGGVTAAGSLGLTVGGDLGVGGGALVAAGGGATVTVGGAASVADAGLQAGGPLALRAGALTIGTGGRVTGGAVTVAATGALANAGLLAGAGRVGVAAGSIGNTGMIAGDGGLDLRASGTFAQDGTVASDAAIAIDAGRFTGVGGVVEAGGALAVTAGSVALDRSALLATGPGALTLASRGALGATGSRIGGNGDVAVTGGTIAFGGSRVTALGALTVGATAGDLALGDGVLENGGDLTLGAAGTLSHTADIVGRGRDLTLTAAAIDNRGGAVLHLGTGTLTLDGRAAVANAGGRIATNGALALSAGSLDNAGGAVTAAGAAGLTVAGDLGNERGLLASGGGLTLVAGAVRSTGGAVETAGALDARLASLDGGQVVATGSAGRLTLDVRGAVTGASVLIGATGDAGVAAGSFDLGRDARLTAGGALTVRVRSGDLSLGGGMLDAARIALGGARAVLTGNGGLIQSTGAMAVDAGSLVTTGGRVAAGGALTVAAGAVDNRGGLLASGPGGATLTVGSLLNDGGVLGGDGAVTIAATTLDNGAGVLAAGGDLALTAGGLSNAAGGRVWADGDARVAVTGTLANRGTVAADRDLFVTAGTLDGGSGAGAGTLAGGRLLRIASGGGAAGRLVAPNALTLDFAGDLANAAGDRIATPGALTLTIGGSFTNAGVVEGGRAVAITTAGAIANAAGGEIVAPEVTLTAGGTLDNRGLINGGAVTLRGAGIANGGAIFGDRVALFGAGGISNAGADAVIATRSGLLSLASGGAVVNRDGALLYSLGDLAIAGADGAGRAGSLENLSADIQAQGAIAIAATRVVNDRAVFTTEEALLSSREVEETDRRDREHRTLTEYVETVTDTQVTADSGPARIIGGRIGVDADSLVNNVSTISAAGDLSVGAAAVTNTAFTGFNTTTQDGTIKDQKRNCFLFFCGDWNTRSTKPFTAVDARPTFTVPSTITAGGTLSIDAVTIANLTLTPGGGTADIFAVAASPGALAAGGLVGAGAPGAVTAVGGAPAAVAATGFDPQFGFAIRAPGDRAGGGAGAATLDLGGLFRFAGATSQFLVEADPRFGNYNDFLSSDYFIDRLGLDPARVQRRLGDGLYEQQLIANQLVALIGAPRIQGYGDAQAQYRALLDAGATYARRFDLGLGVGLSPSQMATLTSDIVLLVETTVQTPSGPQLVLAPRVYLTKAAAGDLTAGGAIIAGRDLRLRASDSLSNAGVLRASASGLVAGGTVVNGGRLDLGARGVVSAVGDLVDRGGAITGGDLTLAAGRDLTLAPVETTRTVATRYYAGRSDQRVTLATTTTNRGTDIAATGNVDLLAGRTLSATATTLAAGGDLTLQAGGNIAIGAATDRGTAFAIGRDGKTQYRETRTEERNVLSDLRAGGDVTVATPGSLSVAGGTVAAGGALVADAGSIAVTGVVDSDRLQRDTLRKSGGLLSSTKTTTRYDGTDRTVVSSTLAGDTVALGSVGDTRIAGSNVVAENGVSVAAGGALDVGTLAATDTESRSTRVKKSGVSLGGGGLFAGVAKTRNDVDVTSVTNTGSLIGSTAGDVTLDAGGTLGVTGSRVAGTGLTRLTGESVLIANATDTATTDTLSKSSSVGLSVKLYENVSGAANSVSGLPGRVDRGGTGAAGTAVTGVSETLRSVAAVTNALTNTAGVSANLGVSSSRSVTNSRSETAVGSSVAGRDVVIAATDDVRVRGSEVTAARDVTLSAGRDVVLESAQDRLDTRSSARASGFGVGVSVGVGIVGGVNASPSISASASRSSGSTEEVTQVNTRVTSGGALAIDAGRDATLRGAVAQGRDVAVVAGRDLTIESVQDTARSRSSSLGGSLSISGPGRNAAGVANALGVRDTGNVADRGSGISGPGGVSGGISVARGRSDAATVAEQSAIVARGGSLSATVGNATTVRGGVLAAVDADGKDSGRLALNTGTLSAQDVADTARTRDLSVGVSANVNDPLRAGVRGANTPVLDAASARSDFAQTTRATIGRGEVNVARPEAGTAPGVVNRDLARSQVVTRDSSSGFTVYADEAAARETAALVTGDRANSTILRGIAAVEADLDGNRETRSPLVQEIGDVLADIRLTRRFAALDALNEANQLSAEDRLDQRVELTSESLINRTVRQRLDDLPAGERAAARAAVEAEVRTSIERPENQEALRLSLVADDLYKGKAKVASGGTLSLAERQRVGLTRIAEPRPEPGADPNAPLAGDIVVTGYRTDEARLRAGERNIVVRAGRLIEPVNVVGGGMVEGTGTGLVNNARDTIGLIADGAGYLLNRATLGYGYRDEAERTSGRVQGAIALGRSAAADPVGTARKLGESYAEPFQEGARLLNQGQTYAGTAKISEAGSDLIVQAATGGSKAIIGIIGRGGKLVPDGARVEGDSNNRVSTGPEIAPSKRSSGETILGSYPEYVNLSDQLDARRFQIPDDVWERMTPAQRWDANTKFLDRTIARGDTITLSNPANGARRGTSFYREIEYMKSKGYTVSQDQLRLIPPVKR